MKDASKETYFCISESINNNKISCLTNQNTWLFELKQELNYIDGQRRSKANVEGIIHLARFPSI